jgi:hypothetical protein
VGAEVTAQYTIIEEKENGTTEVTEKNVTYNTDSLAFYLTACKHANGRDWWILSPKYDGQSFNIHQLTPDGIQFFDQVATGPKWTLPYYNGNCTFSPDGTTLIHENPKNGTDVFSFNRCTGELEFTKHFDFPKDTSWYAGAIFSPSGRYLYYTMSSNIWQLDLQAPDPMASLTKVGEYDGFVEVFAINFSYPMRAPNGKIYISSGNGSRYLHVINNPDEAGIACNFRQRDVVLPAYSTQFFMNSVNYQLGPDKDSPCGLVDSSDTNAFIHPNPISAGYECHIHFSEDINLLEVIGVDGKTVQTFALPSKDKYLRLVFPANLSSGLYFLRFTGEKNSTNIVKKMVLQPKQ